MYFLSGFIVLLGGIAMLVLCSVLVYFFISLVSRKGFKRVLQKHDIIEIMVWTGLILLSVMLIVQQSWFVLLPIVLLMMTMIKLRRTNRKLRAILGEET
ncbi:hypothetical protein ASD24_12315 [Paenibacillus sp. Root52]|uniref:Protein-S-isoprenylcysteine O-methyltransferase Ste14 n=1 Tax=Paenibacillus amylolyticus TaxID=1451 RepID=A0AAP5H091_PAEAM|nr:MULTISPECIES: hypothetical protein [Paenibacillus]KQY83064.1 hypothetical protein ASD24_12315 [Paenibacillus sp. Root52]MDR6722383.1 protein-S-isoprenylcysteine O-methyltransferase Ste14 [Paenibacillus amylolyticus]